jgi:hypothetical protein
MASGHASWNAGWGRMARLAEPPCSRRRWKCFGVPAWPNRSFARACASGTNSSWVPACGRSRVSTSLTPAPPTGFSSALPQWRTEAILRDHPSSLGLEVEFGTEVTSIEAESAAVRVALETGGRRVTFISYDDSYSPPKAVEQVRRLVEQDVIACLSNTLGAASNSATVKFRQSEESATSLRRQWCGQVGRLQIASMEDRLAD